MDQKIVLNWSSGKDAALAYHFLTHRQNLTVRHLLTTLNQENDRIFMHGTAETLLDMQAQRMGLPLKKVKYAPSQSHSNYENAMHQALLELQQEGINTAAYGDIFLEDLRQYREKQLAALSIDSIFPLWKKDTKELVALLEQTGIEAIIVCANDQLGEAFLGKKIEPALLEQFPPGVDPCGEHGEYHTFVYNAPFFSASIPIKTGAIVQRTYQATAAQGASRFFFLDVFV